MLRKFMDIMIVSSHLLISLIEVFFATITQTCSVIDPVIAVDS